jgi:hypothetical protein
MRIEAETDGVRPLTGGQSRSLSASQRPHLSREWLAAGWLLVFAGANGIAYAVAVGGSVSLLSTDGVGAIPLLPVLATLALVEGLLLLVPRRSLD